MDGEGNHSHKMHYCARGESPCYISRPNYEEEGLTFRKKHQHSGGETEVLIWNLSSIDLTPVLLWCELEPTAIISMGPQFLWVNYHLPHETNGQTQPDGGKEGTMVGKCCVFPRVQFYFLNGLGF